MRLSMLSVAIVALLAAMAGAEAMPPVRAGTLECQGGRNVGLVLGSVASLDCVFKSGARPPEAYIATVRRFGLDLGVTRSTKLTWAVNTPSYRFARGELAGTYGGVGANASMGFGGGGNLLVGGLGNAYALQPISVQGQTGFNVAAGVAGLELEPLWYGRRSGRWHRSPSHMLHTMLMIR
ncbi:DUF992 domain-containing protein [Bradyrhizobium sp.]|uniref:DUF992 domain-containing protein n=1 Tax=Bradyrhizobium sp. TaxID=376 RepID=UPI001EB51AC5|nr:DUF992 domain-containing protein [Bradyrhizobium sp.]MBV8918304.1 DUF992 domain-containing protein [Bradyrhizobium sp.]MBV9980722.1 DUF992 domain-containing protein [Bradyrhizobium sp.]